MGRRSKAELNDLVDRILSMWSKDKLTIQQIADKLQDEGIDISRESVRRSLKTSKELATDMRNCMAEARVMMQEVKDNPNTDIAEAVVTRFGGLLLRESQAIDALEFEDPAEAILAASRLANAQAKLGSVRMKFSNGVEAAKKAVLSGLQEELKAHPDLLERLSSLVINLEVTE